MRAWRDAPARAKLSASQGDTIATVQSSGSHVEDNENCLQEEGVSDTRGTEGQRTQPETEIGFPNGVATRPSLSQGKLCDPLTPPEHQESANFRLK